VTPIANVPPAERLAPRVVPLWMLGGLMSTALLGGGLFAAYLFVANRHEAYASNAFVAWVVVTSLLLAFALVTPTLSWLRWRFAVSDELLVLSHGILFHEEKAIPVSRMQHVDLTRGPIERLFGLATLVVFTAGNEGSAFRVPGLPVARAQDIRDQILATRGDDVL
jgi:membrane protein YdbS with pleckstrin-like domain